MLVRIKTEEEFIKEFGEDWRNKTQRPFTKSMDYLFGKTYDIPLDLYQKLIEWKCAFCEVNTISIDMVVFLPMQSKLKTNQTKYILL